MKMFMQWLKFDKDKTFYSGITMSEHIGSLTSKPTNMIEENIFFQKNYAVVGNPNSGKTSLFNALTGLRQKVGNYPGVTVEKKLGQFIGQHGKKLSSLIFLELIVWAPMPLMNAWHVMFYLDYGVIHRDLTAFSA